MKSILYSIIELPLPANDRYMLICFPVKSK